MSLSNLQTLAVQARPQSDADWGSERQMDAENAFFDAFHAAMGDTPEFDDWCLKATTNEMIDEALRLAKERFGNTAPTAYAIARRVKNQYGFSLSVASVSLSEEAAAAALMEANAPLERLKALHEGCVAAAEAIVPAYRSDDARYAAQIRREIKALGLSKAERTLLLVEHDDLEPYTIHAVGVAGSRPEDGEGALEAHVVVLHHADDTENLVYQEAIAAVAFDAEAAQVEVDRRRERVAALGRPIEDELKRNLERWGFGDLVPRPTLRDRLARSVAGTPDAEIVAVDLAFFDGNEPDEPNWRYAVVTTPLALTQDDDPSPIP